MSEIPTREEVEGWCNRILTDDAVQTYRRRLGEFFLALLAEVERLREENAAARVLFKQAGLSVDLLDRIKTVTEDNARLRERVTELKEGWRQGILQKKVNLLPETEVAVHIAELQERVAELEERHRQVIDWCNAYPLDIFSEPDMKRVHVVLKDNGMTLDGVSASNFRHVLEGVRRILERADE